MKEYVLKKAAAFKGINELSMKGEIVIFGSTYMANFPFYELINKSKLENAVYNRSIADMTLEEAMSVLPECVLALKPNKIFLSLGEEDLKDKTSVSKYRNIISALRASLPHSTLYLITLPHKNEAENAFNSAVIGLCDDKTVFSISLVDADHKAQFLQLCHFFAANR